MVAKTGCEACNKASLSLLLLRPSPIAKSGLVAPLAVSGIAADPAAVAGLLPTRLPTQSRFVLRLLRPGYVHIYIPNPPPGVREWLVHRVTEQADLVPQDHSKFLQTGRDKVCTRDVHIPNGMKVVSIPQAHKITDIWIAFSANLWNNTLRAKNKANPGVMQKISLGNGGANTFKPTVETLKAQVLECGVSRLVIDKSLEQEFPFTSLASQVDDVVEGLKRAAARHPKTINKELAVVLRDPVGIAAELNALRLRRNEPIKREFDKPEVMHPLNSSRALLGLKQSVIEEANLASFDKVLPLVTAMQLANMKLEPGTEVVEVTPSERQALLAGEGRSLTPKERELLLNDTRMWLIIYPDAEERAEKWKDETARKNWNKYTGYFNEKARADWVKNFESRMRVEHYEPLERLEKDWWAATRDPKTYDYFKYHFDPAHDGNPPVDSGIKGNEHNLIYLPGPITTGDMTERYLQLLDEPLSSDAASALRMVVGDKAHTVPLLFKQLTDDPGKDEGGMRDKTYDLVKGLVELFGPRWPSAKLVGHSLALFSIGFYSALIGAGLTLAAKGSRKITEKHFKMLQKLLIVQRALEIAVQGAVKGQAPNLPVLLSMTVSAQEALEIRNSRPGEIRGTPEKRLRKYQRKGRPVVLTVLTDTEAIKRAHGDIDSVARQPSAGKVSIGPNASHRSVDVAQGKYPVVSKDTFLRLYQRQMSTAAKAANLARRTIAEFSQPSWTLTDVAKTLDTRLAIAGMLVHCIGMYLGYENYAKTTSKSARIDVEYGLMGSLVGFTGASLQLVALGWEMRLTRQQTAVGGTVAGDVIRGHAGLSAVRILGAFTGVIGGYLDYVASKKKSKDQGEDGNVLASKLYAYSAFASGVTGLTAAVLTAGQVAQSMAARGIGGAIGTNVATRLAANVAFRLFIPMSVTGIGLVMLGASVAFQIGAIILTPDSLQRWVARSYFGTDGGIIFVGRRSDRFPTWDEEIKALDNVIADAKKKQTEISQANAAVGNTQG